MTVMELKRLRELGKELSEAKEEEEKLRSQAEKTTALLTEVPKGSAMASMVEEAAIKLLSKAEELKKLEMERLQLEARLWGELCSVPREEAQVLEMRYISGISYKEIARQKHKSLRTIFILHERGLKRLSSLH